MSTEWNLPEDLSLYMVLQRKILEITLSSWQIKSLERSKGEHFSCWLMVSSQLYLSSIHFLSTFFNWYHYCVFISTDHPRILEKEVPMDRDVHMYGSSPTLWCTASGGSSPVTIEWQWMPREDCPIRFQYVMPYVFVVLMIIWLWVARYAHFCVTSCYNTNIYKTD